MEKLIIVETLQQLKDLRTYLEDKEYVSYDTETTGVEKDSSIIGFSVSAEVDVGYYVILSYWDVALQKLVGLDTLKEAPSFIEYLKTKNLIMHNAVFDCWMTHNNFRVSLMESLHTDTMILGHLLNENRSNGLKELGVALFGEDARKEQIEMKESVTRNGGVLTKQKYELYKADAALIAKYGAKDASMTLKLFFILVEELYEQQLDKFFYEEESMPLLRGPTYELNTTGLKVDPDKLQKLKLTLEAECLEAKGYIAEQVAGYVKDKYPGTGKTNVFNIGATSQRSWLLYEKLGNEFNTLTDTGKDVCKFLGLKLPYTVAARREFIRACRESKGRIYKQGNINPRTGKTSRPSAVRDPWTYMTCGKDSLGRLASKYKWVAKYLEYAKNLKILNTYVEAIQSKMTYGIIRPSFLQHGTTSGRYSSRTPNFQNLPRDDKRVKGCIIARPGRVFVGADYSQLEPRVFASHSKDERLLTCFKNGEDFYSVVGMEVFEKSGCSLKKGDADFFGKLYESERQQSKIIALAAPYGQTAFRLAPSLDCSTEEAREILNKYFEKWPRVHDMMINAHETVMTTGTVKNLFGRPRRIPEALEIRKICGRSAEHGDLPYVYRTLLNLAVNHEIQSTGASIMNRAAIACWKTCRELESTDKKWAEVRIVLQVHDELILEGPEELAEHMVIVLKDSMENTVKLPGVDLIAEPKIANNLGDLK